MKKYILFSLLAITSLACVKTEIDAPADSGGGNPEVPYTPPYTTDLIISEISIISRGDVPGTGNQRNTYIELYNGTGSDIDLSGYVLLYRKNGQTIGEDEGDTLFMSGMLSNGNNYLVSRSGIDASLSTFPTDSVDEVWGNLKPNGDDGIYLATINDSKNTTIIDAFGTETQPSTTYPMCGVIDGSIDVVLQRKYNVSSPTTDWDLSSGVTGDCQWDSYSAGTYDNVKLPTGYFEL